MVFIETPAFTQDVRELLSEESYANFQLYLGIQPEVGDVIENTGGLRKVRWKSEGRGKRGGVRVIYFYVTAASQVRLLLIYRKGVQDTLSAREKSILRAINKHWPNT